MYSTIAVENAKCSPMLLVHHNHTNSEAPLSLYPQCSINMFTSSFPSSISIPSPHIAIVIVARSSLNGGFPVHRPGCSFTFHIQFVCPAKETNLDRVTTWHFCFRYRCIVNDSINIRFLIFFRMCSLQTCVQNELPVLFLMTAFVSTNLFTTILFSIVL